MKTILEVLPQLTINTESYIIDQLLSDAKNSKISIAAYSFDQKTKTLVQPAKCYSNRNVAYLFNKLRNQLKSKPLLPTENYSLTLTRLSTFDKIHLHFLQNQLVLNQEVLQKLSSIITVFCHGSDVNVLLRNNKRLQNVTSISVKDGVHFQFNSQYLLNQFCDILSIDNNYRNLSVVHPRSKGYFSRIAPLQKYFRDPNGPVNIITVCNLIPLKNVLVGIQAIECLIKDGFDINYSIVGVGPDRKRIEDYILSNNLSSHVNLYNQRIANNFLGTFFLGKHVYLNPSSLNRGIAEAYGLVQREALDAGLSVVSFCVGGQAEGLKSDRVFLAEYELQANGLADQLTKAMKS